MALYLLEHIGNIDYKYFDDIISGRIVEINDNGKIYNQIKE